MKLNKLLAVAVLSAATLLTACTSSKKDTSSAAASTPVSSEAASVAATQDIKFGVGYVTSCALSYGTWEIDDTVVAAAFDKDGKVIDARVDVTQYKFNITANAEDATKFDVSLYTDDHYSGKLSKLELGTDYDMLSSSAIGKEVYEQLEAWADWTVGKTAAEVEANEAEIAGCSISTVAFTNGLKNAYAKAYEVKAVPTTGLKVGVGMINGGLWEGEMSNYICGALSDGTKVLTSYVDCLTYLPSATDASTLTIQTESYGSVNKYAANAAEGQAIMSKRDLGDKYGMKSSSAIGAEYVDQCASMDAYFTGKTLTEVAAINSEEATITGVSITASGLIDACKEAAAYSVKDVITDKPVSAK